MWHHILFWLGILAIGYVFVRFGLQGFRRLEGGADATTRQER